MMRKYSVLLALCGCFSVASGAVNVSFYEDSITFTAFSKIYPSGVPSLIEDTLESYGCISNDSLTLITHGWKEKINVTPWIREMIKNFLSLRGNCVFFMDYSNFSSEGYAELLPHFKGISAVLKKKIAAIGNPWNLVLFGFSFGARLAIDAGYDSAFELVKVDKIYACDPAGPGFKYYKKNPKLAARFVQCINTTARKGTNIYNCHQNWRMGVCGRSQIGARDPPLGSHGLCPHFFNAAFKVDFTPLNLNNCKSKRMSSIFPDHLIMGPREARTPFLGDIFAATSANEPWNIEHETSTEIVN